MPTLSSTFLKKEREKETLERGFTPLLPTLPLPLLREGA